MHHDLSEPAKETQHKSSLLGVFTRSCTWLTLKEWGTDYSPNLQLPKFETSQVVLLFLFANLSVILITQYVQVLDLTKPRTKRAHVAHLPQELLNELHQGLLIPRSLP